MHNLWIFFLKKRAFTYMLIAALSLGGIYSLFLIPKESSPEVIIPFGIVTTTLRGAGAEDTEKLITNKLEDEIANLENIDTVTSSSREGVSIVSAQFNANADIDKSIQDLKDAVDKAKATFPADADEPFVSRVNFSDQPILIISASADVSDTVALCREGNVSAWKRLYNAHFDFAYRTAHRLGAPHGEVEDVVHEAFEVAFQKLSQFSHGLFTTWLYRIVANVVSARLPLRRRRVARLRKRRVRDFFHGLWANDQEPEAHSLESTVAARQTLGKVGEVMRKLSAEKREVFALHELEGLSHEEIARLIGCKVETVRSRLHYARKDFEKLARSRGLSP